MTTTMSTTPSRPTPAQALKWVNQTVKDKQMIAAAKLKAQQKKDAQANSGGGGGGGGGGGAGGRGASKHPEPIEPVFTVAPQVMKGRAPAPLSRTLS